MLTLDWFWCVPNPHQLPCLVALATLWVRIPFLGKEGIQRNCRFLLFCASPALDQIWGSFCITLQPFIPKYHLVTKVKHPKLVMVAQNLQPGLLWGLFVSVVDENVLKMHKSIMFCGWMLPSKRPRISWEMGWRKWDGKGKDWALIWFFMPLCSQHMLGFCSKLPECISFSSWVLSPTCSVIYSSQDFREDSSSQHWAQSSSHHINESPAFEGFRRSL